MRCRVALVASALVLTAGCEVLGGAGQRPAGTRQVQLGVPDALRESLGSQVTGLQLAAVVVPREQFAFHTSPSIDPAQQSRLVAYLPLDASPVLAVQTPGSSAGAPGRLVARLVFDDGLGGLRSRLPLNVEDLDLGTPVLDDGGDLRLDEAHNPLGRNDADGDGDADLRDPDDDGDGVPDLEDSDADGDGVDDALQAWSALADSDADGAPDLFE